MGINRGTVLDLINGVHEAGGFSDYNSYSYLFDQVDTMPESMENPEPQWIPVTDRLPERDELVLVTYKTTDKIHLCKYFDDGSENPWWSYIDDCCAWNNVILAWMPLPEPYKGVKE